MMYGTELLFNQLVINKVNFDYRVFNLLFKDKIKILFHSTKIKCLKKNYFIKHKFEINNSISQILNQISYNNKIKNTILHNNMKIPYGKFSLIVYNIENTEATKIIFVVKDKKNPYLTIYLNPNSELANYFLSNLYLSKYNNY